MKHNIVRFGVDYLPQGMGMQRRALYADTAEGNRLWIVDASDIYYTATQVLVDLLNAGLAAQDMLAALTEASETLAGLYGGGNTNLADVRLALGKVDTAIAKAKGECE